MRVAVLNGVNLDVLHRRDPELYGGLSLNQLESQIYAWARELELLADCRQTNSEGEYVGWCHDALELFDAPVVEVHLSNIEEREDWRKHSVLAEVASARVIGKGPDGYREALEFLAERRR